MNRLADGLAVLSFVAYVVGVALYAGARTLFLAAVCLTIGVTLWVIGRAEARLTQSSQETP